MAKKRTMNCATNAVTHEMSNLMALTLKSPQFQAVYQSLDLDEVYI